jgi:hypothetical protein
MVQDRIGLAGERIVEGSDILAKPHRQFIAGHPLPGRHPGRGPGPQHLGPSAGSKQSSRSRGCRRIGRDGQFSEKRR